MAIKILVNGAFGRMGQLTSKAIQEHPNLELVGQTGREYDLKKAIQDSQAEVVVDFTLPECVYKNTNIIIDAGVHPLIGTSGLTEEQINTLKEKCTKLKLGGIIAPNFSLGAVLMMRYAKEIVKYMPNVEIIEMHHNNKIDSPSGTALRSASLLAALIKETKTLKQAEDQFFQKDDAPARGVNHHGIRIHAVRLPGFLAHQQIIFGGRGETLTIRHDSIDRQSFMPGICFACEKVVKLDHLVYGLEEIL